MYKIIDEKPIQKTTDEKKTKKRPSGSLLVLFPTILLILIFGATMGTVIGFKSQLKSFEYRIARLEESTMLKTNHDENNLNRLKEKMAEESLRKTESQRRVDLHEKTAKKPYYAKSPKLKKVSVKNPKERYRAARSGETINGISAPL